MSTFSFGGSYCWQQRLELCYPNWFPITSKFTRNYIDVVKKPWSFAIVHLGGTVEGSKTVLLISKRWVILNATYSTRHILIYSRLVYKYHTYHAAYAREYNRSS